MALALATVVGTRPQLIKAAAVSRVLGGSAEIRETLIDTAQHYDRNMSKVFFEELDIPRPTYDLGIGSGQIEHSLVIVAFYWLEQYLRQHPEAMR